MIVKVEIEEVSRIPDLMDSIREPRIESKSGNGMTDLKFFHKRMEH
jgi:hypothetical protein